MERMKDTRLAEKIESSVDERQVNLLYITLAGQLAFCVARFSNLLNRHAYWASCCLSAGSKLLPFSAISFSSTFNISQRLRSRPWCSAIETRLLSLDAMRSSIVEW